MFVEAVRELADKNKDKCGADGDDDDSGDRDSANKEEGQRKEREQELQLHFCMKESKAYWGFVKVLQKFAEVVVA